MVEVVFEQLFEYKIHVKTHLKISEYSSNKCVHKENGSCHNYKGKEAIRSVFVSCRLSPQNKIKDDNAKKSYYFGVS